MYLVEMKRHLSNFNGDIAGKPTGAEPERKKNKKNHEIKTNSF
jgi:hypothetical protein